MTPRHRRSGWGIADSPWISAAVGLACLAGIVLDGPTPQRPVASARAPAREADHDLLGGLREGDRIAGWTVLGLSRPDDEVLRIDFGRDAVRFAVDVTLLGAKPELPPSQTDRYAIYYGHAHPEGTRIPDGAIRAITAEIARRIHQNE